MDKTVKEPTLPVRNKHVHTHTHTHTLSFIYYYRSVVVGVYITCPVMPATLSSYHQPCVDEADRPLTNLEEEEEKFINHNKAMYTRLKKITLRLW